MQADHTRAYMGVSDHAAICASWRAFKGYTVRPLASTERYYQSVIDRLGRGQELLLYGGTPEIRSCIRAAGARVMMVDRAEPMVHAMGLLTVHGEPLADNERCLEGDWLDMPVRDGCAGLALADDAVNMVAWPAFERFMREAHRALASGGWFACHLLVQPERRYRQMSAREVIAEYEAGKIESEFDFASRINFCFYDESSYFMGWQRSIAGLKPLLERGEIATDHGFIDTFGCFNSQFACPPQREWEKLIEPLFTTEEIFYPREHDYCRFEPLYLLRKRA